MVLVAISSSVASNEEVPAPLDKHSLAFGPRSLVRWESALVLFFIFDLFYGGISAPDFFSQNTIFFAGINFGLIAIMALPEMLIITTGEIDLSVAAMLGLSCATFGYLFEHHVEVFLAMILTLGVGALGGALNGFLVTRVGLPSIAVTIGTLTMFRGLAEVILGTNEVTGFGGPWTDVGTNTIPGTPFAWAFGIFVVLALIYGVVLHFTSTGRSIFAIGLQEEAAFFSGIRVKRIKFNLYLLSGIVCAFVGLLYTYETNTARYDAGTGLELNVVAIVLFGGVLAARRGALRHRRGDLRSDPLNQERVVPRAEHRLWNPAPRECGAAKFCTRLSCDTETFWSGFVLVCGCPGEQRLTFLSLHQGFRFARPITF